MRKRVPTRCGGSLLLAVLLLTTGCTEESSVVPILEIAVFIQVGERIGLWPTLAAVIVTAMAGTALLRHQGLATLYRAEGLWAGA